MSKCYLFLKCPKVFVIIAVVLCLSFVVSAAGAVGNTSDPFLKMDEDHLMKGRFLGIRAGKQPKFLSFNTLDDEISVEMQLSVPFLTIPVKRTIDAATGLMGKFPSANLNLAAFGLAGVVILGSVFIIPTLAKFMQVDHFTKGNAFKRSDSEDEVNPSIAFKLGRALSDHGAPADVCAQRAICALVRKSSGATKQTSSEKIVDGLASNEWLLSLMKGTFVSEAIASGYSGESCTARFPRCKINQAALHNIAKAISKSIFAND